MERAFLRHYRINCTRAASLIGAMSITRHSSGVSIRTVVYFPESAAEAKAETLLRRLLRPEQRETWERQGRIVETIGERRYEFGDGLIHVFPRDGGARIESWCVEPEGYPDALPKGDKIIAQLLHLRADPAALRAAANVLPPRGTWTWAAGLSAGRTIPGI